jgi:hypothetical protein
MAWHRAKLGHPGRRAVTCWRGIVLRLPCNTSGAQVRHSMLKTGTACARKLGTWTPDSICSSRTRFASNLRDLRTLASHRHYFQKLRFSSRSPGDRVVVVPLTRARRRCCVRGLRRLGAGSRGLGRGPLPALGAAGVVSGSGVADAPAPSESAQEVSRAAALSSSEILCRRVASRWRSGMTTLKLPTMASSSSKSGTAIPHIPGSTSPG